MRGYFFAALCVINIAAAASERCEEAGDASRVAVAGGSVTELIYFLGEQDRLVAVDRTSNYPEAAIKLPQIGYVRGLSTEGLLSLKPTLVLGENDMGPPEVLAQLDGAGIETVKVGETYAPDGIVNKLRCVASVLGVDKQILAAAEAKLAPTLTKLQTIEPKEDSPTAAIILVFQQGSAIVAGGDTAGNGLLKMAGLRNALADMDGWKPLSAESLIEANPDYFIVTDRAVRSAGGMDKILANPGVRLTNAGRKQQLIQMDGMTMLGFGPRTLDAALSLSEQTESK